MVAAVLSVIGFATLASSGNEVANEVFVVPAVVPTLAATPVPTVGSATPSPSPAPSGVRQGDDTEPDATAVLDEGNAESEFYPQALTEAVCRPEFSWNCETAASISWREMGGVYQPWAVNATAIWLDGENHATGCFQILLPLHWGFFDGDPLDCGVSARAAYRMWQASGDTFCYHWRYWCAEGKNRLQ